MNFDKPFLFAIRNGAVHVTHRDLESIDRNALTSCLCFIHADVRNLWIGVSAPWNCQIRPFFAAEKEAVLYGNSRRGIGDVSELVGEADIPRRINARVRSL